jgi:mono/diheme cytochrome c family protein
MSKLIYLLSGVILVGITLMPAYAQPPAQRASESARPRRGVPDAPDQAVVDRGQALFGQTCGFCHGKEANGGDGGPDLIRSVLVNHDEHGELIAPVILNGRPDKGMPKFNLTQQQISDIATFLHARNRYVRYRQLYQVKDLVVGDTKAGETYFNSKCGTCHSPTGDLAHVANKYDPETLLRKFLYPAQRASGARDRGPQNQKSATTVTVKLASGQSFSGPLKHLDEFTVSMYDSSGEYHTWAREGVNVEVHDPLAVHLELLQKYTDDDMHNVLAYLETLK